MRLLTPTGIDVVLTSLCTLFCLTEVYTETVSYAMEDIFMLLLLLSTAFTATRKYYFVAHFIGGPWAGCDWTEPYFTRRLIISKVVVHSVGPCTRACIQLGGVSGRAHPCPIVYGNGTIPLTLRTQTYFKTGWLSRAVLHVEFHLFLGSIHRGGYNIQYPVSKMTMEP